MLSLFLGDQYDQILIHESTLAFSLKSQAPSFYLHSPTPLCFSAMLQLSPMFPPHGHEGTRLPWHYDTVCFHPQGLKTSTFWEDSTQYSISILWPFTLRNSQMYKETLSPLQTSAPLIIISSGRFIAHPAQGINHVPVAGVALNLIRVAEYLNPSMSGLGQGFS